MSLKQNQKKKELLIISVLIRSCPNWEFRKTLTSEPKGSTDDSSVTDLSTELTN